MYFIQKYKSLLSEEEIFPVPFSLSSWFLPNFSCLLVCVVSWSLCHSLLLSVPFLSRKQLTLSPSCTYSGLVAHQLFLSGCGVAYYSYTKLSHPKLWQNSLKTALQGTSNIFVYFCYVFVPKDVSFRTNFWKSHICLFSFWYFHLKLNRLQQFVIWPWIYRTKPYSS